MTPISRAIRCNARAAMPVWSASKAANKALAFTSDVTPRYCEADPHEGGKQAVAECWRNLTAVGAEPLAATDNLNFGNPEKPEIMGQLVFAIKGIGEACEALGMPIVSGNVSLYNETHGQAILPTPTIAAVGLICRIRSKSVTIGGANDGDTVFLIGTEAAHLGQSIYLRECLGPRGRPAAACRSADGKSPRRLCPRGHPLGLYHRLPRYFRWRTGHCAGRNGYGIEQRHGDRICNSDSAPCSPLRRRPGPLHLHRQR